jgi:hypothetical protein
MIRLWATKTAAVMRRTNLTGEFSLSGSVGRFWFDVERSVAMLGKIVPGVKMPRTAAPADQITKLYIYREIEIKFRLPIAPKPAVVLRK